MSRPPRSSATNRRAADDALRVAVIGAGAMGEAHLRAYAALPGVRIVGLATHTPARGAELAARYGIEATFEDAHALIDTLRPDGISVTTGEHDHVEPACYALEHGVGVLLEKPIASTVADAERIIATARATGAVLMPGHILRFTQPYRGLKAAVLAGRVGRIVGIAARRDRSRAVADHYRHIHPAFLTAVHDIDLTLWLTGSRATRVRALERRSLEDRLPDLVWAQVELASGVVANISTAYLYPATSVIATSDRIEVHGHAGVAIVDTSEPALTVHAERTIYPDWLIEAPDGSGAFGAEIAHFLECVRRGRPSDVVSIDDALEGIRIADAIVRSGAADGADVWLTARAPDAPAD